MTIEVRHDEERGLLHVKLRAPVGKIVDTEDYGRDRYVDRDEAGNVVGVEFLALNQDGIDLERLPEADRIRDALNAIPRPTARRATG